MPEFHANDGFREDVHVISSDVRENGVDVLEMLIYADVFAVDKFSTAAEVDRLL